MATITKRANGKWQAKCRRKGYKTLSKTFSKKSNADKWAKKIELEKEQGILESTATAERTLVSSLLKRFWEEVASHYKSAANTKYRLDYLEKVLGHIHLIDLSVDVAREFKEYRLETVSGDSVRKELSLLKRMVDHAMKEWNIYLPKGNPFTKVKLPVKGASRERRLKNGEFDKIYEHANEYGGSICAIFELAIETAMRRGEILSLKWESIDLSRKIAHLPVTKNGSSRTIPLSNRAIELLTCLERKDEFVFSIKADSLTQAFQRVITRAGLTDLRFHDLRHEATSRLFEKGLHIMEVASITGHKDLSMLWRYTHLDASKLAEKL